MSTLAVVVCALLVCVGTTYAQSMMGNPMGAGMMSSTGADMGTGGSGGMGFGGNPLMNWYFMREMDNYRRFLMMQMMFGGMGGGSGGSSSNFPLLWWFLQ